MAQLGVIWFEAWFDTSKCSRRPQINRILFGQVSKCREEKKLYNETYISFYWSYFSKHVIIQVYNTISGRFRKSNFIFYWIINNAFLNNRRIYIQWRRALIWLHLNQPHMDSLLGLSSPDWPCCVTEKFAFLNKYRKSILDETMLI